MILNWNEKMIPLLRHLVPPDFARVRWGMDGKCSKMMTAWRFEKDEWVEVCMGARCIQAWTHG